ncbi:MAG: IclR family transcriptional regulator [Nitrospirota bacterium]
MKDNKKVNSIIRAVNILKVLSEGANQLSDISKKLQLGKGTVHRILTTLEETGFVIQDPSSRRYFLGPLIISLSSKSAIAHHFLLNCSHEELKRLSDFSRETVNLQVRMGFQRVCLDEVESQEPIKYISGKGSLQPIHLGSAGKLLLSEIMDEELQSLLDHITFAPVCTNTITDKTAMLREIKKIRKQGYAVSFSERIKGSASISVPIRNYPYPVALSILGPGSRFDEGSMMRSLSEMLISADRISSLLTNKGG